MSVNCGNSVSSVSDGEGGENHSSADNSLCDMYFSDTEVLVARAAQQDDISNYDLDQGDFQSAFRRESCPDISTVESPLQGEDFPDNSHSAMSTVEQGLAKDHYHVVFKEGQFTNPARTRKIRRIRRGRLRERNLKWPLTPRSRSFERKQPVSSSRKQKLILFCLCLVNFTSFLSMSIIAPFFPQEASAKGMREAVSGFVFSVYALVIMVTSPVIAKALPIVGVKFTFLTGVFFSGVSNILFGLLVLVESNIVFQVFCFVVRSFEALGAAAFTTASYTIILEMFPDDVGTVFGFTETFVGVGLCLGPVIGGGLYSLGGYGLPFYILGSLVIVNIPVCWYVMGDLPGSNKTIKSESYKNLLTIPSVIAVCVVIIVSSQSQGFLDPTLEPHVRQFGIKADMVGVLFLVMSAAFSLFAPFVGWLSGKMDNKYPVMVIGLVLMTGALLFMGPSPFLPLKSTLWLSIVSIVLLGVSSALAYVPTFECLLQAAVEFMGPSLGGVLSDLLDFPLAASVMGVCSGITAIIATLPWIFCKDNSTQLVVVEPDSSISEIMTEEENTLLQVPEDQSKNYGSI
ncbi:MFS-type transporter SLC18B1-like isoform X2 [Limulus polyphemus]|uniref:MFS-type transporter SLC18B1-like isoform X2 n=1 Tax=Limulus polyphemus TaxID=6850 RepID=A0ABM1S6K0_LIMPO|nr:MFS-type transporter SLC18B1-like isoform X2 [Limulus polyphemus]